MIKFFALIPRAEGVTPQAFHDHWRHPHGTWGRLLPSMRSFVCSHQVHSDRLTAGQSQFEGVSEVTFDTIADGMGLGEAEYYKTYLQPDELLFVDVARLEWVYADEEVLVGRRSSPDPNDPDALWLHLDRPTSIKLLQFIRADGNPDWAGPADEGLGERIGAFRHVRNHVSHAVHGAEPAYLGVRELWWPTRTSFEEGVQADPAAFAALIDGGGSSVTLLAEAERMLR